MKYGLILIILFIASCGSSVNQKALDKASLMIQQLQKSGHMRQMNIQEYEAIKAWWASELTSLN